MDTSTWQIAVFVFNFLLGDAFTLNNSKLYLALKMAHFFYKFGAKSCQAVPFYIAAKTLTFLSILKWSATCLS